MSNPYVREVGAVQDMDGQHLKMGVDYDSVTIGLPGILLFRFTQAQAEEFAQLFVSAVWQAGQQKARMDGEAGGSAFPGCTDPPCDGTCDG